MLQMPCKVLYFTLTISFSNADMKLNDSNFFGIEIYLSDIFGRVHLSFFLYISIVNVKWPAANSKYNCKHHITDFSLDECL